MTELVAELDDPDALAHASQWADVGEARDDDCTMPGFALTPGWSEA